MNNKIKMIATFCAGVASGVVGTVLYFRKKNEKESVVDDSVITLDSIKKNKDEQVTESVTEQKIVDDICEENGYTNYSKKEANEDMSKARPYIITPDEFGEDETHETETLFYFEDGILTDSEYIPIEDIETMVGSQSLKAFGMYEDDAVYVRNDEHLMDYEILKEPNTFAETVDPSEEGS